MHTSYNSLIFTQRLREFAKNKYGTLSRFAKALDIELSQLSRIVNGKTEPGFFFFTKLAALGCNMDWLFGRDEIKLQMMQKRKDKFGKLKIEKLIEIIAEGLNTIQKLTNTLNTKISKDDKLQLVKLVKEFNKVINELTIFVFFLIGIYKEEVELDFILKEYEDKEIDSTLENTSVLMTYLSNLLKEIEKGDITET